MYRVSFLHKYHKSVIEKKVYETGHSDPKP